MRGLMPHVDVVIGNEEDTSDIFGISAAGTDVEKGDLAIARYPDVASQVIRLFPNISKVAITLRQSLSASHNNWGAMLYDAAQSQPYSRRERKASIAPTRSGTLSTASGQGFLRRRIDIRLYGCGHGERPAISYFICGGGLLPIPLDRG